MRFLCRVLSKLSFLPHSGEEVEDCCEYPDDFGFDSEELFAKAKRKRLDEESAVYLSLLYGISAGLIIFLVSAYFILKRRA